MAKNDEEKAEDELECTFVGASDTAPLEPLERSPTPPSPAVARQVALVILEGARGRYRATNHFSEQMSERDFDIFDMEYAIRNGNCIGLGEYSAQHRDHKYTFRGNIDGVDFDAVFSLSAAHDFVKSPLMKFITGCWKTKTGKRKKTY